MKAQMGGADETKKEFVKAGAIASEAIGNSRTVAAFNMEDKARRPPARPPPPPQKSTPRTSPINGTNPTTSRRFPRPTSSEPTNPGAASG